MNLFVRPLCAVVLLMCLLVNGCGNKGPLYLPDDSASDDRQARH